MSVTLSITQKITATLADGTDLDLGSLTTPETLTLTNGTIFRTTDVVPDAFGEDVIWTAGEGGMDKFEVLLFKTDVDVWLEFRNEGLVDYIPTKFAAGPWHILTSDDIAGAATSAFDGAVLVDGTDYDQIDRIEAHRDEVDGQGDATVTLILLA